MGALDAPKLTSSVRLFEEAAGGGVDEELRTICQQVRVVCEAEDKARNDRKKKQQQQQRGRGRWL